jgi:hypothetical protein
VAAWHGTLTPLRDFLTREPLRPGPKTGLGVMARERRLMHITDVSVRDSYKQRDPLTVASVELGGIRTLMAVPLLKEESLCPRLRGAQQAGVTAGSGGRRRCHCPPVFALVILRVPRVPEARVCLQCIASPQMRRRETSCRRARSTRTSPGLAEIHFSSRTADFPSLLTLQRWDRWLPSG